MCDYSRATALINAADSAAANRTATPCDDAVAYTTISGECAIYEAVNVPGSPLRFSASRPAGRWARGRPALKGPSALADTPAAGQNWTGASGSATGARIIGRGSRPVVVVSHRDEQTKNRNQRNRGNDR